MESYLTSYADKGYSADTIDVLSEDKYFGCAFSIKEFIYNRNDFPVRVESVSTFVEDIEIDDTPDIVLDSNFQSNINRMNIYLVNDGWGDYNSMPQIHIFAKYYRDGKDELFDISKICEKVDITECSRLSSGEIFRLATFDFDSSKMDRNGSFGDGCYEIYVSSRALAEETQYCARVYFDEESGTIGFSNHEGGDTLLYPFTSNLISVIDVDKGQQVINYTSNDANPQIDDTFNISTTFFLTKSCKIKLYNSFVVSGEVFESPLYSIKVYVPVFTYIPQLIHELAEIDINDTVGFDNIVQKYLYSAQDASEGKL